MRTQGMFHCHIQHIILPLQKSIICIHLLRSLTTSSTPSATGRHRPPPAAMPRAKTTWRKPSRSFLMALAAKALRRRDWKSRLQPWPRSETTRSGHPQWVEVLGIPKKETVVAQWDPVSGQAPFPVPPQKSRRPDAHLHLEDLVIWEPQGLRKTRERQAATSRIEMISK